jgi:hypothetical protein
MTFKISRHQNTTFWAVLQDTEGNILAEYEMCDLSYARWNDIGLMVTPDVARKIKDPKHPSKMIDDIATQTRYNQEAEVLRNAMRLAESIEGGSGIDWEGHDPQTLQDKGALLMSMSTHIFYGLLGLLSRRVHGAQVSAETAEARFQRLQVASQANHDPQTDDHQSVDDPPRLGETNLDGIRGRSDASLNGGQRESGRAEKI